MSNITITDITLRAVADSAQPTFELFLRINYDIDNFELYHLDGHLYMGNTYVAPLHRLIDERHSYRKPVRAKSENYNRRQSFIIPLNHSLVDYIEKKRQNHREKNVEFQLHMQYSFQADTGNETIYLHEENTYKYPLIILHSQWVNNFCPILGIGKFFLFELNVLDELQNASTEMKELHSRAQLHIRQIHDDNKLGEWENVMRHAREIVELFYSTKDESLNSELERYFQINNFGKEEVKMIRNQMTAMYDLFAKYGHPRAHQRDGGKLNPLYKAFREDANYAMLYSIGLVNLIFQKQKRANIE